jgi:hypothetical protein
MWVEECYGRMEPSKEELLELMRKIDRSIPIENAMTLVGAGDTAMALLGLKAPTAHLDFTGNAWDISEFNRACVAIPMQGFQVHTWPDGLVFGNQLPDDYLKSSFEINAGLTRIYLRALHPLDIVVTRIDRLRESDMRYVRACIKQFKLSKNQISKRARSLSRVGNESKFESNLGFVLGLYE